MKLRFDPNQPFQLEAIAAVADLFDGQPRLGDGFGTGTHVWDELVAETPTGVIATGNILRIDDKRLEQNTRAVQLRNDIDADSNAQLEAWTLRDTVTSANRACPHFSVEMETGTGKTYVYLRTILELASRHGFQKFVIVVPSVAIREGVLKNIEITADHFRALYNTQFEHFVYDSRRISRLRHFAHSTTIQIMVINIDAFRKNFTGTDENARGNVIYKESDKLSGRQPIEYVQAARPIVIIDEPQSVDSTERAQEAIKALNPLCTLRYSATHRNPYNLVYRLDPIKAYELGLVKRIIVASASAEETYNAAFARVESIELKRGIRARVRINVQGSKGPSQKTVTVTGGADLFAMSNERAEYADGYSIAEISAEPGREFLRFTNGLTLKIGEEIGGPRDDVWQAQIKHTVRKHLERAKQLEPRGIKVLSLFFIDRVSNYRDQRDDGSVVVGKFAEAIERELSEAAEDSAYQDLPWLRGPLNKLHGGYFAQDRKGGFRDTRGDTQADDEVYALIMKEKERLLDHAEPLRFIFSHSALREGWDNPNVFQICTLNETRSSVKKRQEIGRGLRLAVDSSGERVRDESVNKLFVMANESYEAFARALQSEYEEDCGVTFGKVPFTALARLTRTEGDKEVPIGRELAAAVRTDLVRQGLIDEEGRIQPAFAPAKPGFRLELSVPVQELAPQVIDLLRTYQLERHVQRDRDERVNRLRKEVTMTPEFQALWNTIKPRTTYRVQFDTSTLIARCAAALRRMERIKAPQVLVTAGQLEVGRSGIATQARSVAREAISPSTRPLPDILAYLQNETELTRRTIASILVESGRLDEFVVDPQSFLDRVANVLRAELQRLLVDGVKYERLRADERDAEWQMVLFENEELINYLNSVPTTKTPYEYVVYDSQVERDFALQLEQREDIRLFMKLPRWFVIETPVGKYNPDWAILKHDGTALYLVRETKGTRDFLKLRTSEADKVRCGKAHFDTLGVSFDVVTNAREV